MALAIESSAPGVLAAFGGGVLSFVSPCVLPLVPGYLSLMSGVSVTDEHPDRPRAVRRLLGSTLLFVAGFTVVFVALGAGASAIGQALREHQRVLERVAGITVIVMGLVLAGLWSPLALLRERRLAVVPERLGAWAPPVMGMAFAFGWTPCIGPILAGVLALAGSRATLGDGVVLLGAYSLGLGVPFVVSGLALGRMTTVFSLVKRHISAINLVAGGVLVAFGLLLVFNRVSWLSTRILQAMETLNLDFLTRI